MCQAMEELMKDVIEERYAQGVAQGIAEGIVKMCKKYKGTMQDAISQIMEDTGYDEERATAAVKKYW